MDGLGLETNLEVVDNQLNWHFDNPVLLNDELGSLGDDFLHFDRAHLLHHDWLRLDLHLDWHLHHNLFLD